MQPTLSPPTDSLYKFMAIGGMVLAAFCLVYPTYTLTSLRLQRTEAKRTFELRLGLIQSSINEATSYKLETDKMMDEGTLLNNQGRFENGSSILEARKALHDKMVTLLQKQTEELHQEEINVKFDDEVNNEKFNEAHYEATLCAIFFAFGMFISSYGFILWHNKVQRYLDYSLRKDALEKGYCDPPEPAWVWWIYGLIYDRKKVTKPATKDEA